MPTYKSSFYATRDLFLSHTGYTHPLSYDEWLATPDDHKAAVLYLQFFDQITLAWYKLRSVYSDEADGVSEVLQYINKNVDKIKSDKKRFTANYMYRVFYNCLYCLCRDPNRYKRAYENEVSNIVGYGEDELDLFDTVQDNIDDDKYFGANDRTREAFWRIIEDMDLDTQTVVAKLLGGDVKVSSKGKTYTQETWQAKLHESWNIADKAERKKFIDRKAPKGHDCYTDDDFMKITAERENEIIAELRIKLAPFKALFNI